MRPTTHDFNSVSKTEDGVLINTSLGNINLSHAQVANLRDILDDIYSDIDPPTEYGSPFSYAQKVEVLFIAAGVLEIYTYDKNQNEWIDMNGDVVYAQTLDYIYANSPSKITLTVRD